MSKKEKIDNSLYSRLKEEKTQRYNSASFSNPLYYESTSTNKKYYYDNVN